MQKLVSSRLKKSVLAFSFATLLLANVSTLEAKSCDSRTFNIKISEEVATSEILNQLSDECGFSVITKDPVANEKLGEKLFGINIKKMSLDEIFDVLVSSKGLEYKYDKNMLQISGLTTRTFRIDYVNTVRAGVSNTDISLTGDSAAADDEGAKGGSLSTGATITSNDKFSFWAKMEAELGSILNTPSDKFKAPTPIINREAGLVTVSGTTAQVNRIAVYVYKLSSSSRQTGSNAATETYNNEVVKSVFAGILLDITPEITDDGEIILKINPSISTVKSQVKTDESGVRRLPPDLMKKQISSVVKLRDGEKIVLGGLISSRKGNTTYKVPILGNLPVLGYAFKQERIAEIREELVVIITPHILNPKRDHRKVVSLRELGYQGIK